MTSNDIVSTYFQITKSEKTADGDLLVYGKAAGPDLDLDGQICDPAWLRQAMPEWQRWGNVRAQHGPVAAGVGQELDQNGDDWNLKSLIVDPDSIKKVEKRVYKGYSIGVKNARVVRDQRAPKGRIVGGDIVEISLVDRPSNPTATMTICKAFGGGAFEPVDADGEIVKGGGLLAGELRKLAIETVNGVLSGELIKELDDDDDIDGAWAAIGRIADLIISEAEGLKRGHAHEIMDIRVLLDAAGCLRHFIDREEGEMDESDEGYGPDMDADIAAYKALLLDAEEGIKAEITKSVLAELGKGAPAIEEDEEDEDEEDEDEEDEKVHMTKAASSDTVDQLLTKVAGLEVAFRSATETAQTNAAKVEALEAELKKFAATPLPGGPRLVAPSSGSFKSAPVSDAERYRLMSQAPNLAPDLAAGLRELAAREEGLAVS